MIGAESERRNFLRKLAAAVVSLPATTPTRAQHRFSRNPFALGVASGSPTHSSVVLWTRLFDQGVFSSNLPDQNIPVHWEVSADDAFKRIVQSGTAQAVADLAHSVHVELEGLPENTAFYYRFRAGAYSSPIGKTRTFASPGSEQTALRIAFASCQNYEQGYFNAYTHLAKESPDLMIFLGDYIYEYAPGRSGVRSHSGSWCLDLSDYRKRYAQYRQDPDLQLMHASCPWVVTWDDHEVQNDYAGTQEGSAGPSTHFAKRRLSAYQAYYEHMPLKASSLIGGLAGLQKGGELRIYDHYRFGQLMSLSMLDARQYRDPQACTAGGKTGSGHVNPQQCELLWDEKRSMLGATQERWLEQQLSKSQSHRWNLIAQPTLFGLCAFNTPEGVKVRNDGWDGYPAARRRLTDQLIRHQVPNPVMLGGDVHESWVGYIKEDYQSPTSQAIGVEFCGTSLSSYDGKNTLARQKRNPHFIYSDGTRRGYTLIDLSDQQLLVRYCGIQDHRAKESEVETLARFRVQAGSPQIERV